MKTTETIIPMDSGTMAIFRQKGRKKWQARVWMPEERDEAGNVVRQGRVRSFSTGTEDENEAKAVEAVLRMAHVGDRRREGLIAAIDEITGKKERLSGGVSGGVRLSDAMGMYRTIKPDLSVSTLRITEGVWRELMGFCGENWPVVECLHDVSRDVAFAFGDWLRGTGIRGKTFNNKVGYLQAVFGALTYRGGLSENVWSMVERASTDDSLSGRAFDNAELELILARCKELDGEIGTFWFGACMVALYTGLRMPDILRLEVDDVQGDRLRVLTPSKTKRHGIRVLMPLHPALKTVLDERCKKVGSGLLFAMIKKRKEGWRRSGFNEDVLGAAGIDGRGAYVSFHCFRHTFDTRLASAGVGQDVRMKLGGWTNAKTEAVYDHDFDQLQAAILRL